MYHVTPPPRNLAALLIWLRETYPIRVYKNRGLPVPDKFASGYTQGMVAECLKAHGFERCEQPLLSRMETGETWPGNRNPEEKQIFLHAAFHCYGIDDAKLKALLGLALWMKSGADGLPEGFVKSIWRVLDKFVGGA